MRLIASNRSPFTYLRLLWGASVIAVGAMVASSCLVPDFNFGGSGMGGSNGIDYPDHCFNRATDGDETDRDCGGSCMGCPIGASCTSIRDCQAPESGNPAILLCGEGGCELDCPTNTADCNSIASDGCEASLLTSIEHCGHCGSECDPESAIGQCMNGECRIKSDEDNQGCFPNFANCNLRDDDGCEVDLRVDVAHCGACEDSACSAENGEPECFAGECSIECDSGFVDCDEEVGNGCEVDTEVSVAHCGGCDERCPTSGPEFAAFCKDGVCGETECEEETGDCDGDGVCSDSLLSATHCGECFVTCTVSNGLPGCEEGAEGPQCIVESCDDTDEGTWADCDGDYLTGCEVNTSTSKQRCGGCVPGVGQNCGEKEGEQQVTVASCMSGACQVASCETGYVDCDKSFSNGCETNTSTDEDNCGGCDIECASKPHTSGQCVDGSCDYSCTSGWQDLNNDRYEESGSDGCETRRLSVVGNSVWGAAETGGSSGPVSLQHTLVGAAGTQRMILVGVVCRGQPEANCELTQARYGNTQLTLAGEIFQTDSSAKVYYALDADLPAPGSHTVIIDRNDDWGSLAASVIEVSGADQSDSFDETVGAIDDTNCGTDPDAMLTLDGLGGGTLVFVAGGGAQGQQSSGAVTAEAPLTLSQGGGGAYIVYGAAYAEDQVDEVDVELDFTQCYRSVIYAVAVHPHSE